MNGATQRFSRRRIELVLSLINVHIALILILFLHVCRLTVSASFIVLAWLLVLYPLHRSGRAITVATVLLLLTVLIPVDVYVREHHGSLVRTQHSGLRWAPVVYGFGAGFR